MIFIKSLIFFICILLGVAFFTLWERKILGYMQLRKGPNLVGGGGVLQPFADGLKLFLKNMSSTWFYFHFLYLFPMFYFLGSLLVWIPLLYVNLGSSNNFLVMLCISGGMAICTFFCGWGSNSKFSLMGGIRASAQMISYEVVFAFGFLLFLTSSFGMSISKLDKFIWGGEGVFLWGALPMLLVIILAETNRTPFDLVEGESELVSGFNTEFSSVAFVLLFLGEYSFICFFSVCLELILSWGGSAIFFLFFFVWSRASFPRKRYDSLMMMMWVWYFPMVISFLVLMSGFSFM